MSLDKTTKATDATLRGDRHKYSRLSTRQPDPLIEAMNVIAKRRKTTVAAILGEAALKTVQEDRALLPQKLLRKLHSIGLNF